MFVNEIGEIERLDLPNRASRLGERVALRLEALRSNTCVRDVRGRGLLHAVELGSAQQAASVVRAALRDGAIFLQSGVEGNVVTISPPLVIEEAQLELALDVLGHALEECE